MNIPQSDALVIFGATGDLVYKKIFPALYLWLRQSGRAGKRRMKDFELQRLGMLINQHVKPAKKW